MKRAKKGGGEGEKRRKKVSPLIREEQFLFPNYPLYRKGE